MDSQKINLKKEEKLIIFFEGHEYIVQHKEMTLESLELLKII